MLVTKKGEGLLSDQNHRFQSSPSQRILVLKRGKPWLMKSIRAIQSILPLQQKKTYIIKIFSFRKKSDVRVHTFKNGISQPFY